MTTGDKGAKQGHKHNLVKDQEGIMSCTGEECYYSEQKHTPGPWKVPAPKDPYWIFDSKGVPICSFSSVGSKRDERHIHNAALIAAAPELLEACKLALDELQIVSDREGGSLGRPIDRLINIISRAEGRA